MKTWSSSVRRLKRPWLRMRTSSWGCMEELTWATIRKSSHLCLIRWAVRYRSSSDLRRFSLVCGVSVTRVFAGEQFPIFTAAVVYITSAASSGSRASRYLAGAGVAHEPGHADRSELWVSLFTLTLLHPSLIPLAAMWCTLQSVSHGNDTYRFLVVFQFAVIAHSCIWGSLIRSQKCHLSVLNQSQLQKCFGWLLLSQIFLN